MKNKVQVALIICYFARIVYQNSLFAHLWYFFNILALNPTKNGIFMGIQCSLIIRRFKNYGGLRGPPGVDFINIKRAHFLYEFFAKAKT